MSKSFVFVGHQGIGSVLAENLVAAGFKAASDVDTADVIFTFCTSQESLENVYLEEEGIVSKAKPGSYLVDFSSTTPSFAREISAIAQVNDLHVVEAPLVVRDVTLPNAFGNPQNLLALVAGEEADANAVAEMLAAVVGMVEPCGGAGEAQLAKCAFTIQQVMQLQAFMEADALCRASGGLSAAVSTADRLVRSQLVSPQIQSLASALEESNFTSTCTVEVLLGEIETVLASADELNLIVPLSEAADYLLRLLATIGGVDMAASALSLVYRDEEESSKYGLDWGRAQEAYTSLGSVDDYDDEDDDEECDCGHHHHHHHDDEDEYGGFGGYSAN